MREAAEPPKWVKPQLTRPVDEAPKGDGWLHEIKYDGYRMHAGEPSAVNSMEVRMLKLSITVSPQAVALALYGLHLWGLL